MARFQTKRGQPGIYNASLPTIPDGQGGGLAIDVNGRLVIAGTATGGGTAPTTTMIDGGVYNTSAPTYTNGQATQNQADVNGNLKVTLATLVAGEDLTANVLKVEERFNYLNIAAGQATTTVKSGSGFLHTITFNSAATATNVTTVYDSTTGSGTVIAIPAATTATVPTTLTYDVSFATGLTILTATANGSNMTVSYR